MTVTVTVVGTAAEVIDGYWWCGLVLFASAVTLLFVLGILFVG